MISVILFSVMFIVQCSEQTAATYITDKSRNTNNLENYVDDFVSTLHRNKQSRIQQDAKQDDAKLCKTKACKDLKKSILYHLDTTYEPCNDMYMFACGGMMKDVKQKHLHHDSSGFRDLLNNEEKLLKKAIEGLEGRKEKDAYKKVYDWYSACLNTAEKKKLGASPLLKILKSIGTWPLLNDDWKEEDWDLEKALALVYRDLGESPLFAVTVGNNATDVKDSLYKFKIDKPKLPLEALEFYLKKTEYSDKILFAYFKLLLQLVKLLQKEGNHNQDLPEVELDEIEDIDFSVIQESNKLLGQMKDVLDIIKFEMKMAKALSISKAYYITPYTTLAELQNAYGDFVFDWKRFIALLYEGLPKQPSFEDSEKIYIGEKIYFKQIMDIIATTKPRIIANYIMVRILYAYGGALSPEFRIPYLEYYGAVYGVKTFSPAWSRCIRSTKKDLMFAVTALFVKDALPEPDLRKAEDLVQRLAAAYLKHMDQVKWMDEKTRQAAETKIKAMIRQVGYPRAIRNMTVLNEVYADLNVDPVKYFDNLIALTQLTSKSTLNWRGKKQNRKEWDMDLTEVNAQYSEKSNKLAVAAALLQPPLFHHDYPRSRTYGSIGMATGHEMTHGFDGTGAKYDKDGNFRQWWSKETYKKFKKRLQCMIKQYSGFMVYKEHLNGNLTIDENIADNGGLRIAYEAYLKSLSDQGPDLAIPGINLTSKQMFFLSYGQLWCKYKTKTSAIHSLHTDVHSPGRARVNLVLKNMKEFSKAFKCPKGSPMNPEKKCVVW